MDEISVLQLGEEDWRGIYTFPSNVELDYEEHFDTTSKKLYDIVFLDREPYEEEIGPLYQATKAYTLYVVENVKLGARAQWLYDSKMGQRLAVSEIQNFLNEELKFYFSVLYGRRFWQLNLAVSRDFKGSMKWNGSYDVVLEGDFGEEFRQAAYWRNNIQLQPGQVLDLWLEYSKTPGVEISLSVTQIAAGSLSQLTERKIFSEEELREVVHITGGTRGTVLFFSLFAKGNGTLHIKSLHERPSRGRHGYFLPGGERYVTSDREEIFAYFDPMDRKPPLNVYFSGYRVDEGFEGYNMMRNLGCPYLLLTDVRLEGGVFYLGNENYDKMVSETIRKYMDELGFTSEQVIFSGISMGSCGAMYHGCDIKPHAMILGKPLASVGSVAANEQRFRPGGFPTSLDVLQYLCGDTDELSVQKANEKFWNKFDETSWRSTKFIVSYLFEDDYENTAYSLLINHIQTEGVQLYGRGLHGRHKENTAGIVSWFTSQFRKLLREDFGRRIE